MHSTTYYEAYLFCKRIKAAKKWNEVRDVYLDKKNNNDDPHKKSRAIYAEAVNEVFIRI